MRWAVGWSGCGGGSGCTPSSPPTWRRWSRKACQGHPPPDRLVEGEDLEQVRTLRAGGVDDEVDRTQDLLQDYVPTWNPERTSLSFCYERVPMTATQLRERLEAAPGSTRS